MTLPRLRLALPVVVFVCGCSTTSPKCDVPRLRSDMGAKVVIFRPSAVVGILYATPVSIDACRVQNVRNNSCVVYELPPGTHKIAVEKRLGELGSGEDVTANLESGKTYYLHQSVSLVAGIGLVSKESALQAMPALADLTNCKEP